MKKLFSILTALIIGGSSIVLAMHVNQQDPLCIAEGHEGFIYDEEGAPPEGTSPENLPSGMESAGIYRQDFRCDESNDQCLWVYDADNAKWVECTGTYVDLR